MLFLVGGGGFRRGRRPRQCAPGHPDSMLNCPSMAAQQSDLKLIQGEWHIAELEMDGMKVPGSMIAGSKIVVTGERFATTGMGAEYAGVVVLRGSTSPKQIDMKFDA